MLHDTFDSYKSCSLVKLPENQRHLLRLKQKKMLQVLVVAILAVVAHAQSRDQCCMPNQWEGYEDRLVGAAYSSQGTTTMVVSL